MRSGYLAGKRARPYCGGEMDEQHVLADTDLITVAKLRLMGALAIDKRSIATAVS